MHVHRVFGSSAYICRLQILQGLGLIMPHSTVQRFQQVVQVLLQLRWLSICVEEGTRGSMDASLLHPLSGLQELHVEGYELVNMKGVRLAPSLTSLDATGCDKLDLDATLPHLQKLGIPPWARVAGRLPALSQLRGVDSPYVNWLDALEFLELNAAIPQLEFLSLKCDMDIGGGGVRMSGGRLSLPGLTRLNISSTEFDDNLAAELAFERMPALQKLYLYETELQKRVKGFSTLRHLTSLSASAYYDGAAGTVVSLLRAAPPSLRRVDLSGNTDRLLDHGVVEVLAGCTQLAEVNGRPYSEVKALLQAGEVWEALGR